MSNTLRFRERRIKLWNKNPYCFWCKKITKLPGKKNAGHLKDYHATLDHLYSKWNKKRVTVSDIKNTVLACWSCNRRRNIEEQKHIPIEIRRQMSNK